MRPRLTYALALAALLIGCPRIDAPPQGHLVAPRAAVTIKGSDTMILLAQRIAERYMAEHPGAIVQVTGGGSGTGIAALINGTTTIANASRPLKASEAAQVLERRGAPAVEHPIALDAIVVYVHEENPIAALDLETLAAIYRGEIEDWAALGGASGRIVVYGRENNSGTYAYFKEEVLQEEDFTPQAQALPGTAAVAHAVAKDRRAIGYGGVAFSKGVKALCIKKDASSPGVLPTGEQIASGAYPLSRALLMITAGAPSGQAREVLSFARSQEGQALASKVGYYPLPQRSPGQGGAGEP